PARKSVKRASRTIMNSSGLSTEPWCSPTFTSIPPLSPSFILTAVVTPSYMALITLTNHSSTPRRLKAHHTTYAKHIKLDQNRNLYDIGLVVLPIELQLINHKIARNTDIKKLRNVTDYVAVMPPFKSE